MSLALARKYRPKRFADVAVQSHVAATLKGAIERGRVAQGYLLCGPRGVGKTTLARVLAMALNCERRAEAVERLHAWDLAHGEDADDNVVADPTERQQLASEASEPCGVCTSCQRIWSGSASLDVVEIDAASNRGVDDARELRERAMYAPSGDDRYKVYIVDEAHMLTREAWNALLKILEEPPPRVVFVFATTEPQKIAQTAAPVLSRLQRFDFKRMSAADVRERLVRVLGEEQVAAEPDALAMIARAADGSMRDALSLTDQVLSMGDGAVTADRVRDALGLVAEDEFLALLDIIAARRAADVFPFVGRLADAGIDFGQFLTGLGDMLRAQLAVALGGVAADVSERARAVLDERRDRFAPADLLRMLAALTDLEPRFRKSGQQQLLLETLLVRFALLDRSVDLEEVLRQLGSASGGGGGGDGGRAPAGERGRALWEPPAGTREQGAVARGEGRGARGAGDGEKPAAGGREPRPNGSTPASQAPQPPKAETPEPAPPARSPQPQPAARAPQPAVAVAVDLNRVVERWDDLVERMRKGGKGILATALAHATPAAITARGELTIELDEPNEFYAQSLETGKRDVLEALREWFSGVERVALRQSAAAAASAPPKRLTDEEVRSQRVASLRKRDPVLGAAIDALDLDVLD